MKLLVLQAHRSKPDCYACDAPATGVRDLSHDARFGGLVPACARHAEPKLGALPAALCIYCNGPTRTGSFDVDGDAAHAKCHREESR